MNDASTSTSIKQSAAQRQLSRYAQQLQQRAYDCPELRDDDTPAHLRNNPSWVDVIGRR